MQMFAIALFIFSLSLIGMFYPYNRGALLSACVVLYALTAGIAGKTHFLICALGRALVGAAFATACSGIAGEIYLLICALGMLGAAFAPARSMLWHFAATHSICLGILRESQAVNPHTGTRTQFCQRVPLYNFPFIQQSAPLSETLRTTAHASSSSAHERILQH